MSRPFPSRFSILLAVNTSGHLEPASQGWLASHAIRNNSKLNTIWFDLSCVINFCTSGYITQVRCSIHLPAVPQSSVLPIFITAMTLPSTDYPIPPNHSPFPMPDLSAITLQSPHPSPQQQGTQNTFLYSHLHPAPMLAFPFQHSEPLVFGPSGIVLTAHDQDHPVAQPTMRDHTWHPTVSALTPQSLRTDAWVPNMEARRRTAAAYKHL